MNFNMDTEKIVHTFITPDQKPTEAQINEITAASAMPVIPNEDAPELTAEQYEEMSAIAKERHTNRYLTFDVRVEHPNKETLAAMLEAERISRDPSVKRYSDVEEALRKLKE